MFGKKGKKGELIPASMELVRLAIPRRVYTQSHVDYVIEVFQKIKEQKNKAKGIKIVNEQKNSLNNNISENVTWTKPKTWIKNKGSSINSFCPNPSSKV